MTVHEHGPGPRLMPLTFLVISFSVLVAHVNESVIDIGLYKVVKGLDLAIDLLVVSLQVSNQCFHFKTM